MMAGAGRFQGMLLVSEGSLNVFQIHGAGVRVWVATASSTDRASLIGSTSLFDFQKF